MPPMGQRLHIRAISAWKPVENRPIFACVLPFLHGLRHASAVRALQKAAASAELMETILRHGQDGNLSLLAHVHAVLHRTAERHGHDRLPLHRIRPGHHSHHLENHLAPEDDKD